MIVRFEFDNTEAGIKRFFKEELPELLNVASALVLCGYEVSSVDLENRKIILNLNTEFTDKTVANIVEQENNSEIEKRTCNECIHFKTGSGNTPGFCSLHQYSTLNTDSCKLWKSH